MMNTNTDKSCKQLLEDYKCTSLVSISSKSYHVRVKLYGDVSLSLDYLDKADRVHIAGNVLTLYKDNEPYKILYGSIEDIELLDK